MCPSGKAKSEFGSEKWSHKQHLIDNLIIKVLGGERRQVVKASVCGSDIRGFDSPRSPQ